MWTITSIRGTKKIGPNDIRKKKHQNVPKKTHRRGGADGSLMWKRKVQKKQSHGEGGRGYREKTVLFGGPIRDIRLGSEAVRKKVRTRFNWDVWGRGGG